MFQEPNSAAPFSFSRKDARYILILFSAKWEPAPVIFLKLGAGSRCFIRKF